MELKHIDKSISEGNFLSQEMWGPGLQTMGTNSHQREVDCFHNINLCRGTPKLLRVPGRGMGGWSRMVWQLSSWGSHGEQGISEVCRDYTQSWIKTLSTMRQNLPGCLSQECSQWLSVFLFVHFPNRVIWVSSPILVLKWTEQIQ